MDYFTRNILHALAKQMLNSITKKVFFRAELYECTSTIKRFLAVVIVYLSRDFKISHTVKLQIIRSTHKDMH